MGEKGVMPEEWLKGWKDGKSKSESLGRPFKTEDFPRDFQHRGSLYFRGYAEGVLSGSSKYYTNETE